MRRLILAVSALLLVSTAARADTILQITGVLADGGTAAGRLSIDSSGGANPDPITISDRGQTDTFQGNFIQLSFAPGGVGQEVVSYDRANNQLELVFPLATLVGYNGGTLCSTSAPCNLSIPTSYVALYSGPESGIVNFTSLTAAPFAMTPEPPSLLLLATGVSGLYTLTYQLRKLPAAQR